MTLRLLRIQRLSLNLVEKRILKDVSLFLNRGESVGLVGESGSGKTMTALAVMGLAPVNAEIRGKILLNGKNLLTFSEKRLRSLRGATMAMIFQDSLAALNPLHLIGKQLQEMLSMHASLTRRQKRERVEELMHQVELPVPLLTQYPHQLSGGQRQRVLIAMMMAHGPELLIADEPTTALDASLRLRSLTLLRNLCDSRRVGLLLITHDIGSVSKFTDRIYVMKDGGLIEHGRTKILLAAPQRSYTRRLLAAGRLPAARPFRRGKELLRVSSLRIHYPLRKGVFKAHL